MSNSPVQKIIEESLETIMGDRFGRYSKYIIQERALPDVRDGLKPVQRRILYAMYKDNNLSTKGFRKSAKTVGNVIGNYHPHGDSSVYEAMVRMSQSWKLRYPLIEMHGNNGSIDGDGAAAMRYTEARVSKIAETMLADLEKHTVDYAPNFDDTAMEPTVLTGILPNCLVNGVTGIAAGYATDIPSHNLSEVIDGILLRLEHKNITISEIMEVILGPDFPTGGIIQGGEQIKKAYETGKGRIIVRSLFDIEDIAGGKKAIVITELPFEVNKANLARNIEEIKYSNKVPGIYAVRDESDRTGIRLVVECSKGSNVDLIIAYLLKNTNLQKSYNFNMVGIFHKHPKLMGILEFLDAYIEHQKQIILNRSLFDCERAQIRSHIVDGLIKAVSMLDDVINVIRSSSDKKSAKENLVKKFEFTMEQAEAVVMLQLYRLTNTDINELRDEHEKLAKLINSLLKIINNESKLISVLKKELKHLKKSFGDERRSKIEYEVDEIVINDEDMIIDEQIMLTITKDGYIKRSSLRSYSSGKGNSPGMKEGDEILLQKEVSVKEILLTFTDKGNYVYTPIHTLNETKWKDLGQHLTGICPVDSDEKIVYTKLISNFENENDEFVFATRNGLVKRTPISEYDVSRFTKPLTAIKLKTDDDLVVAIGETNNFKNILIADKNKSYTFFNVNELPLHGVKAAGVKGKNVSDTFVTGLNIIPLDAGGKISIDVGNKKPLRKDVSDLIVTGRGKKGKKLG